MMATAAASVRPAHGIDDPAQPPGRHGRLTRGLPGTGSVAGRTDLRRDEPAGGAPAGAASRRRRRAPSAARAGSPGRSRSREPAARSATASDSTPSATTLTPSWWARSTVVRTMVAEARVAGDRAHQRHVQLELVDGPAAQALQRREAGAEVVEGDPHAELGQLGEEADADLGGPGLLAHLQREHPAGHPLGAQELGDDGREPGIGHRVGADVDRDRDDPAGRWPRPGAAPATAAASAG